MSPRRVMQRGVLTTHLRGEATERFPKPRAFMMASTQKSGHGRFYENTPRVRTDLRYACRNCEAQR